MQIMQYAPHNLHNLGVPDPVIGLSSISEAGLFRGRWSCFILDMEYFIDSIHAQVLSTRNNRKGLK